MASPAHMNSPLVIFSNISNTGNISAIFSDIRSVLHTIELCTTRRLHRRSLRLPMTRKWAQSRYWILRLRQGQMQIFLGLKVGEGLDFQIWDYSEHIKQKELFSNTIGFQHVQTQSTQIMT